jgi:hypothetical protein
LDCSFFLKNVGSRTRKPIPKSIAMVLTSIPPTLCKSLSISPVLTCITFIGIRPRKVAKANFDSGTFKRGLEILMNQLGKSGVTLRNNR